MLTNFFIYMGWSRDDLKWRWTQFLTFLTLLTTGVIDIPARTAELGIHVTDVQVHWIQFIAVVLLWVSGKFDVSSLPSGSAMAAGKVQGSPAGPPKLPMVLLACALAGMLSACASLPLKQKAVVGLQASEMALEASHDAERALCSPAADKTQPITHCDGAGAAAVGLTDALHRQLATQFAIAFDVEIKAANALKAWRSGDPPPSDLADYKLAVDEILKLIAQTFPKTEPTVVKAQAAVDEAAKVAALVGVK
jgi:hypothetical protein